MRKIKNIPNEDVCFSGALCALGMRDNLAGDTPCVLRLGVGIGAGALGLGRESHARSLRYLRCVCRIHAVFAAGDIDVAVIALDHPDVLAARSEHPLAHGSLYLGLGHTPDIHATHIASPSSFPMP